MKPKYPSSHYAALIINVKGRGINEEFRGQKYLVLYIYIYIYILEEGWLRNK